MEPGKIKITLQGLLQRSHLILPCLTQGKHDQALTHFTEAKHLIEDHQLVDMKPDLDAIKF